MSDQPVDVAVVGGGHNGLTAATLLARAGLSVLVLERRAGTGGAAVSEALFPGHRTRLSRYAYLVSLLPDQLAAELTRGAGRDLRLLSRATASYTPLTRPREATGLLVQRPEQAATAASFRALTGDDTAYAAWQEFHREMASLARVVAPTLLGPLPRAGELRARVADRTWQQLVEQPLGRMLRERFADDTVRGVVATDALIGTGVSLDDPGLAQNRCFLYHAVGNGTGEWRVPVGGMGAVTDTLARAAAGAGARLRTGVAVTGIETGHDEGPRVTWQQQDGVHTLRARSVLAGVSPWTLTELLGEHPPGPRPEGCQLKVNLLVDRLPRLRSGVDPAVAFAGTVHLNEGYAQLERAHAQARAGLLPDEPPGEVYCHSLTDPSILGPGAPPGRHTLTYFGLHTPAALFAADPAGVRAEAVRRALGSLQQHLAEPLADCLATDAAGRPCVDALSPLDVEAELGMPGGHIFHGDLAWPWADEQEPLDTPARRWGVATRHPDVLLCGSGARRGGAVSGLGGYHAARAILEER